MGENTGRGQQVRGRKQPTRSSDGQVSHLLFARASRHRSRERSQMLRSFRVSYCPITIIIWLYIIFLFLKKKYFIREIEINC